MTEPATTTNSPERRRWNDTYWTSVWPKREQMTLEATAPLLDALSLRDGDRVLDVGSGAGRTSMVAAGLVGPSGSVVGADISSPLVEFSRRVVEREGIDNATFQVADVQVDPIEGGPFSVVMSQFGVMFFEQPVVAFANVRAHAAAGARLGFTSWQAMGENAWFVGFALWPFVAPPPVPAPGNHATGPFALADVAETTAMLEAAGWQEIACTPVHKDVALDPDVLFDDGQASFLGVPADRLAEANAALEAYYAPMRGDDGRYAVSLAFNVFTASNPS